MTTDQLPDWLKQQAEQIVKRGRDVRQEISRLSSNAAEKFHRTKDGLLGLSRAVLDGAVAGAQQALPAERTSALREVIAGLADGLSISANALKLTLQESRATGKHFADEDLNKVAGDFRDVREKFADAVGHATKKLGGQVADQFHNLTEHASRTLDHARPAFESAIRAAAENPAQVGKEAVCAGAGAAREAAGILFSELGKRLDQAGQHLRQPPK